MVSDLFNPSWCHNFLWHQHAKWPLGLHLSMTVASFAESCNTFSLLNEVALPKLVASGTRPY